MSSPTFERWGVKSASLTFGGASYEMASGPAGKSETKDAIEVTALSDSVKRFITGALKETDEFTVTLYQKSTIKLGDYVSVGHNVTIHGADVDDYALIGMGATLLDDAHVGEGAIVAAGALVLKGTQIGPHEIWGGVPAKFIKKADPAQTAEINKKIANNYAMYASWYKE